MFGKTNEDRVIEVTDFPQASAGAPIPIVLADERTTVLEYYMQDELVVGEDIIDQVAIIQFSFCLATKMGPPNEEAISGHPLYNKGLRSYRFYRVEDSSRLKQYKVQNRVHPYHKDELFDDYVHYIFCFHDLVFDCICKKVEFEITTGSLLSNIDKMKEKLK